MDFIENIQYRNMLDTKAAKREKLTKEEKEWLATNPMYNEKYTEPLYQQDVIKLCNNKAYSITVKLKSQKENSGIIPVISTVLGKGKITAHKYDEDGTITQFDTKALGVLVSDQRPLSTFDFISPS